MFQAKRSSGRSASTKSRTLKAKTSTILTRIVGFRSSKAIDMALHSLFHRQHSTKILVINFWFFLRFGLKFIVAKDLNINLISTLNKIKFTEGTNLKAWSHFWPSELCPMKSGFSKCIELIKLDHNYIVKNIRQNFRVGIRTKNRSF